MSSHTQDTPASDEQFLADSRRLLDIFPIAMPAFGALLMFILCFIAVSMS
jgi:hypothetical protein